VSKENQKRLVAFNSTKDSVTSRICAELNITTVAISGKSPEQIISDLSTTSLL
jgi:hypothetical protein